MADRSIVRYLEPRNEHGPYWSLDVERSSDYAGREFYWYGSEEDNDSPDSIL